MSENRPVKVTGRGIAQALCHYQVLVEQVDMWLRLHLLVFMYLPVESLIV